MGFVYGMVLRWGTQRRITGLDAADVDFLRAAGAVAAGFMTVFFVERRQPQRVWIWLRLSFKSDAKPRRTKVLRRTFKLNSALDGNQACAIPPSGDCPAPGIGIFWTVVRRFVVEKEHDQDPNSKKTKRSRWLWPMGLLATGMAGAAVVLRGCWHSKMSWPVRSQGVAYQVCTGCGIKRLFDEDVFRGYGPYSYDVQRLLAYDQARRLKNQPQASPDEHRTAS